jgi:hypothetical protein
MHNNPPAVPLFRPSDFMNIHHFVSGSAVILAAWLVATFIWEVPADRYPTLGRGSVPLSQTEVSPAAQGAEVRLAAYQAER